MNVQSLIKTLFYNAGYSIKKIRPVRAATGKGRARAFSNEPVDLMALLHPRNPYEGFDYQSLPFDEQGWGGNSPVFELLIKRVRPRFIVEVGTWKGASALTMAEACKALELDAQILCIDTWLGALEFWTNTKDSERYLSLDLKHGFPAVYYQFLANVCHRGLQSWIVPFPQTASTAALWLRQYGLEPDMIYVDASHEEEDVYEDIANYFDILKKGGVLFGDDYGWDGVRLAVDRFSSENKLQPEFYSDKWVLTKA